MSRYLKVCLTALLLTLTVGILCQSAPAQTGVTTHYKFQGYSADGQALGENGAIQLTIHVDSGHWQIEKGKSQVGTKGFFGGSILGSGGEMIYGGGTFEMPELLLVADDSLASASFQATLIFSYQTYEDGQYVDKEMPMGLDLTWTATEPSYRAIQNSTRFFLSGIEHSRDRVETRYATTSGTVTYDGNTYEVNDPNWWPYTISKVKSGDTTIMHYPRTKP